MDRTASLINKLESITDPRPGEPIYPLVNVLFMTICAVIAGADDYVAIARFANTKKDWFAKFLDMSAGVPSHDRFNAIVNKIKPEEFEPMLLAWLTELHRVTAGQVIAIDGKTLRRSYDTATGKAAVHMVSAWATANHISLVSCPNSLVHAYEGTNWVTGNDSVCRFDGRSSATGVESAHRAANSAGV